jgi:hypothetical protein
MPRPEQASRLAKLPRERDVERLVSRLDCVLREEVENLFAVPRPAERVRLECLLKTAGRHAELLFGVRPPRP